MNAFLRGFTKVFSGNFYATPRTSATNTYLNYLERFPSALKRNFPIIDFFDEPDSLPLTVKATLIYKESQKSKRNPVK